MIERSRVRIPAATVGEFSSPGSTFCADSYFRYPFHPRVTTVARKKSRSFCQKCRWQVTAKTRIHLTYVDFLEPCFGIGHNLSLICQMTSEDIKHQTHHHYFDTSSGAVWKWMWTSWAPVPNKPTVSVDVKQHFNQLFWQNTTCSFSG